MNLIDFSIHPSAETNDHEVRIIIDGFDWLDDSFMGLDPPFLFEQLDGFKTGRLVVARCNCGEIGCGALSVDVTQNERTVRWRVSSNESFEFDRIVYEETIGNLLSDNSWEDLNRRVERLVTEQFFGTKVDDKLEFQWASARIKPNTIYLSYCSAIQQCLLEFNWDGETEESALKSARSFGRERFPDTYGCRVSF